jgi:hypothetical protein
LLPGWSRHDCVSSQPGGLMLIFLLALTSSPGSARTISGSSRSRKYRESRERFAFKSDPIAINSQWRELSVSAPRADDWFVAQIDFCNRDKRVPDISCVKQPRRKHLESETSGEFKFHVSLRDAKPRVFSNRDAEPQSSLDASSCIRHVWYRFEELQESIVAASSSKLLLSNYRFASDRRKWTRKVQQVRAKSTALEHRDSTCAQFEINICNRDDCDYFWRRRPWRSPEHEGDDGNRNDASFS